MSLRPFKILGIEHVGIAVESMEGLSEIFSDILGLEFTGNEEVKDQQVITDIYQVDNSKLEFLKATSPDSPIARFIGKKVGECIILPFWWIISRLPLIIYRIREFSSSMNRLELGRKGIKSLLFIQVQPAVF